MKRKNTLIITSIKYSEIIQLHDIVYCKADGSYSEIILKDQRKVTTSKNLLWLEQRTSQDSFFRIHKSYLINLQYLSKIFHNEGKIALQNNHLIPISRYKKQDFWRKIESMNAPT